MGATSHSALLPLFDLLDQFVFFFVIGPDCFIAVEGDFVKPFALAVGFAAEMGGGRNPQHPIQGDQFVVNAAENAHGSVQGASGGQTQRVQAPDESGVRRREDCVSCCNRLSSG